MPMALLSTARAAAVGPLAHGLPTAALKAAASSGASLVVLCPPGRRAEAVAAALKAVAGGALQTANGGIALRGAFVMRASKGSGHDAHIVPARDDDKGAAFLVPTDDGHVVPYCNHDKHADGYIVPGCDDGHIVPGCNGYIVPGRNDDKQADGLAFIVPGCNGYIVPGRDDDKHADGVAFIIPTNDGYIAPGCDDQEHAGYIGRIAKGGGRGIALRGTFVVRASKGSGQDVPADNDDKDADGLAFTAAEDSHIVPVGNNDKDAVVASGNEDKPGLLYSGGNRKVFVPQPEMSLHELVVICHNETGRLLSRARPPQDKLTGLEILKGTHEAIKEEIRKVETQEVPAAGGGGRRVVYLVVGLHLRVITWAGKVEGIEPRHYLPWFLRREQSCRLPSRANLAGTLMELLLYSMLTVSAALTPFIPEPTYDFTDYP